MASCRHHSGYLADDEAGHPTYVARVSGEPTVFPSSPQPPRSPRPRFSSPTDVLSGPHSDLLSSALRRRPAGSWSPLSVSFPVPTPPRPPGAWEDPRVRTESPEGLWLEMQQPLWGAQGSGPQVV